MWGTNDIFCQKRHQGPWRGFSYDLCLRVVFGYVNNHFVCVTLSVPEQYVVCNNPLGFEILKIMLSHLFIRDSSRRDCQ